MPTDELTKNWIPHLRDQFERARPVLFTGAGFCLGARNIKGRPIPTGQELKRMLWEMCFPGTPFEGNSLQDLYQHALLRHPKELTELLMAEFTVESDSVSDWYRLLLGMPWQRVYTLNIDDLPTAAARKFDLPRKIVPVSAMTSGALIGARNPAQELECVYLNGSLSEVPDNVTFSVTQYAERLARPDPWYMRFVTDLLTSPVVFIGTVWTSRLCGNTSC